MDIKKSIGLCSLLLTSIIAHASVGGTVFQDLAENGTTINYGTQESNDMGVEGIKVTAYPGGKTTTTNSDGTWSLPTTTKVRIEFSNIPSHLKESPGQSSVQFLEDNEVGDLALYNPSDYAGDHDPIAMTFITNGKLTNGLSAVKMLRSYNSEINENTKPTTIGDIGVNQVGSVWGLAYDRTKKVLYTSAVVRRYAAMGPEGTGAIYKIDINDSNNPIVTLFTKVADTGTITANESRRLASTGDKAAHDPIFDEIGRNGLGDLDISEDGTKLYTINLKNNSLVEIDITNPNSQKVYKINNPFSTCPDNNVKSWGIGQKDGEVYVGSVCTTNLTEGAYISKLAGTNFEKVHQIKLDMKGESSLAYNDTKRTTKGLDNNARWGLWITDDKTLFNASVAQRMSYPAPILSDIIFDENNGMILGFTDRTAMQAGVKNYAPDTHDNTAYLYDASGDIYRVCKINGIYYNEGTTQCPQHDTAATNPNFPEFFTDEEWEEAHKEIALGGLAYQQGSSKVLTTTFDPVPEQSNNYDSAGLVWMNTDTGKRTGAQRMVGGGDQRREYNGKAGGMGDIEYLSTPAPTEIGNRVWADDNGNCVQDANETGIAGVSINLYANTTNCTGIVEQTTTTDNTGHYLFTNIQPGINYSICIDNIQTQTALNERNLTCSSDGEGNNGILNNNDAIPEGESAKILVPSSINIAGANNHSFDFGFVKPETPTTPVTPTPSTPETPTTPVTPTTPITVTENNRTIDHTNGSCDCHSYTEDSTPTLNIWSMLTLISLTSFMAFFFRKEFTLVD